MKSDNPTVSVVIPTYNRADLLMLAIESVFAQTYHDYELIIIDDGSTDNTAQRAKDLGRDIRYVYQKNGGASAAQNKGVEVARGKWVAILASDDTWSPDKLELQVQALVRFAGISAACVTDCSFVGNPDYTTTAFDKAALGRGEEAGLIENPIPLILGRHPALFVQSLMVDRQLLLDVGGFDRLLKVAEDTDLFFRLSFKTKLSFVNKPLVQIDSQPQRTDKLSRAFLTDQEFQFKNRVYLLDRWLNLTSEQPDPQILNELTSELKKTYHHMLAYRVKRLQFLGALHLFRELRRKENSNTANLGRLVSQKRGKA